MKTLAIVGIVLCTISLVLYIAIKQWGWAACMFACILLNARTLADEQGR